MATRLGYWSPDDPEWHDARRWRIGGSEIAQVCGWSPYGTADDLLATKLDPQPRTTSRAQERGNALEDAVLGWAATREGLTLEPADKSKATYVHDDHPFALFNPDGIAWREVFIGTGSDAEGASEFEDVLIEAKTTADRAAEKGWGRAGSDKVPLYYAAQVQWGLGVLGLDRAVLACLHGATNGRPDLGLAVYRIAADPSAFSFLLTKAEAFLDRLELARKAAA